MYIVVSHWEVLPGKEQDFEDRGPAVRETLRKQPGVVSVSGFRNENGGLVAVHAYESQDAYNRIVNDPNGAFVKAVADNRLEECARWVRSDRGESID